MHQITTLESGNTFAICNCQPESCLALGVTQYYNTPAFSQSNYVAEIDKDKCVACGQCTDKCANNAIQMGQKLCTKTPVEYKQMDLPDDLDWPKERWNPEHRTNRKYVADSGTAPCKTACPAHIAVQGYIKLAAQGKYMDALELIKKENPFPAVCGRICNKRCEAECTRGDVDEAVAIDEVKRFIADHDLHEATRYVPKLLNQIGRPYTEKIAVIGGTGSGKSTLVSLIPRLYDAGTGSVSVMGADVRTWPLDQLRHVVATVPQRTSLVSGTIRSNLTWRDESATDDELWAALDMAQASEFVRNKPQGLDAPVEAGGKNFSGGQRQRLTIARALVGSPQVLIMDDSASALDFKTDAALRRAIRERSMRGAAHDGYCEPARLDRARRRYDLRTRPRLGCGPGHA